MRKSFITVGFAIAAAIGLSACGGGGSNITTGSGNAISTNEVVIQSPTLQAGRSTALTAHVMMRGLTPTSMTWSATAIDAASQSSPAPIFSDALCSTATYVAPIVAGTTGEGLCNVVMTIPADARAGRWRITNSAASGTDGRVTGSADLEIVALPSGGFRLIESSVPLTGYANRPLTLSMPFTARPGANISNVKYEWSAATENPSINPISGARNSLATVVPVATGQYQFNVKVSAEIDGFEHIQNGSVIAVVDRADYADILDAGQPQIVRSNSVVSLIGTVLNRDDTMSYKYTWRQIDGPSGGPARVTLNNANSTIASFVSPAFAGSYGFELLVERTTPSGSIVHSSSKTTVIVDGSATGIFNITAGNAQVGTPGTPVVLSSAVGSQAPSNGVTYIYQWSQVGATPAAVSISNATAQTASFIPTAAGIYTFNVTVTARSATGDVSVSAQTQVNVIDASSGGPSQGNIALTANAGPAQSVALNQVVMLNGGQTLQGGASAVYGYTWRQIGTSPAVVAISNATSPSASFIPQTPGTYEFELTVRATTSDGVISTATSETRVVVGGGFKTYSVSAGNAQTVSVNTAAVMTGGVVTQGDYSGARFAYSWAQVGASPAAVTLSNPNSLSASFIPTVAGTYTFEMTTTVFDGGITSSRTARTQVLATP